MFNKRLISLTGINNFSFKSTKSFLVIRPKNRIACNKIIDYLSDTDANFHSIWLHYKRQCKVIIRNPHHSIILTDISNALTELGHSVTHVVNIKNNHHHVEPNQKIFMINTLLYSDVVIKKPHAKRNSPPQ